MLKARDCEVTESGSGTERQKDGAACLLKVSGVWGQKEQAGRGAGGDDDLTQGACALEGREAVKLGKVRRRVTGTCWPDTAVTESGFSYSEAVCYPDERGRVKASLGGFKTEEKGRNWRQK